MQNKLSEATYEIALLAERMRVAPINQFPGCWEFTAGPWWVAVNGHRTLKACSKGPEVQPFSAYVEYNGFPAGNFNSFGGLIAAGQEANEGTFIEALRAVKGPSDE